MHNLAFSNFILYGTDADSFSTECKTYDDFSCQFFCIFEIIISSPEPKAHR